MSNGWQIKRLDELYEIARGGSPRPIKNYMTTEPDGINWIKISDATASTKYIYETKEKIKPEGIKMSRLVHEGDFILSNSMSFGRPYIMKTTGCIHDGWLVLHAKSNQIDNDYMYYLLGSDVVYQQFDRLAAGSTVRNLNSDLVRGVTIPVPPLPEQQRIVAVLDEAFAGIATATDNAKKNLRNARELFESNLQSIFTTKRDEWAGKKFGTVCHFVRGPFGGSLTKSCFKPTGYAVYEQQHAIYDQFDEIRYFIDEEKFNEMQRFELKAGDLIMSCSGTMGKVAIVPEGIQKGIINQALLKLSPNKDLLVQFLRYWMRSQSFQAQNEKYSMGAAIKNVASVAVLKQIDVPMPPLAEQQRIVAQLDTLSTETKRLEAIYQQKLDNLAALKQSILQKAFAGELRMDRLAA